MSDMDSMFAADAETHSKSFTDEDLAVISKLAHLQLERQKWVAHIEEKLEAAKALLKKVQEEELPNAMKEIGMTEFKLTDGTKVTIKNEVYCSIPKDDGGRALNWLRDHNFGGLIKNQIIAEFGKGEDAKALEAAELLAEAGFHPEQKQTVHPQTLKAFAREQIEKGNEFPMDYFGAHIVDKAKVELPK